MTNPCTTPVAIIVFKRLDATQRMFSTVRAARPQQLFIIADGWRNELEKEKCLAVREYIEKTIDWPCTVYKDYAEQNLGCKMRVVTGLNWVFSQVEEAIIIEDDCVPDQSFFPFCQQLLEKYRHNPRIMQIAGLNLQQKNEKFDSRNESYYFSDLGEIWGWATWRRAWALYDVSIAEWPKAKAGHMLSRHFKSPAIIDYWEHLFDEIYEARNNVRQFDAWAAQWVFARFMANGITAVSTTNLIQNFGDDEDATRQKGTKPGSHYRRPVLQVTFPLRHPTNIEVNEQADKFTLHDSFRIKRKIREKILFFLKQRFPSTHSILKHVNYSLNHH